tara:strand:- start:168 stop:1496 length:1329 start_codon:yes stop_codon:yes gene_type:complete
MTKYWCLLGLFALFNCSKKEVFGSPELIETTIELDFSQTLGGSKNDAFYSVKKTADGGYIAAGYSQSNDFDINFKTNESFDILVAKFSFDNTLEWKKTFGGAEDDRGAEIVQTLDGGFAVLGFSKSSDREISTNAVSQDFWLVKLSNNGTLVWEKSFGFSGADYGTTLTETEEGGLLITGVLDVSASGGQGNAKTTIVNHAGGDFWVLKLNRRGELEWSKYYGGSFTDTPLGIVKTTDNGFILVGSSDSNDVDIKNNKGSYDFWVIKLSSNGVLLWEKSFGGSEIDEARAISASHDGNFIVVGDTRSSDGDINLNNGGADIWVLKISTEGNLIWEKTFGGTGFDVAQSISMTQDNGFVIAGSSRSSDNGFTNQGQNDALILKINSEGILEWQKIIGGSEIDFLYDAVELDDKTIIAVGESSSSDGNISLNKGFSDGLILKIK